MTAFKLAMLWFAIVVAFTVYGFFASGLAGGEPTVGFGAIGIGVASCAVVSLIVIKAVRSRQLGRHWAVVMLLASSAMGTILPALVVQLFQGGGWLVLYAFLIAPVINLFALIVFVWCVFACLPPES